MARKLQSGFRFQFSLRTFLIAMCTLGVGGGLLGKLFLRYPDVFLGVMGAISVVVPFVLAIGTVFWLGIRRQRSVGLVPLCATCDQVLSVADPRELARCPECEADLAAPEGMVWMRDEGRHWGLVIWAAMLLLMPVGGGLTIFVAQALYGSSPGGLGFLSNQDLIDNRLPSQLEAPWVWRELNNRLTAGNLSNKEVDRAINKLVAHMKAKRPQGWNQPLHWSGDEFIEPAIRVGAVSDKVLFDLCDAFHGTKPTIRPLKRLREGPTNFGINVEYGSTWGSHSNFGVALAWEISQILLDGKPIQVRQNHKHSENWSGHYQGNLAAGEHELTVEIEAAYIDQSKLIGLDIDRLPRKNWPKARKQWKTSVSAPLTVNPQGKPVSSFISLVTDKKRAPAPNGGLRIERFVVQRDDQGYKLILKTQFSQGLTIPLSYDVTADVGDQTVSLGRMWVVQSENGQTSSGSQLEGRLGPVAPHTRTADIILTPNAAHIEQQPEVSEIWGKESQLRRVPLERLDLEEEP